MPEVTLRPSDLRAISNGMGVNDTITISVTPSVLADIEAARQRTHARGWQHKPTPPPLKPLAAPEQQGLFATEQW